MSRDGYPRRHSGGAALLLLAYLEAAGDFEG